MTEFELIYQKFLPLANIANQSEHPIIKSIGDDCAVFAKNIAISHDVLNEGVHFFSHASPEQIANKAFAVNLSDLAAMAATPIGFLLSLSLPTHLQQNTAWLDAFSSTLQQLAKTHACPLIGGDTSKNQNLSIGITIIGQLSAHCPYRHAAIAGDDIWITGQLGHARLALEHTWGNIFLNQNDFTICQRALYQPPPRIDFMRQVAPYIHAAIDVSDGLLGDLQHILKASSGFNNQKSTKLLNEKSTELRVDLGVELGAKLEFSDFSQSPIFLNLNSGSGSGLSFEQRLQYILSGGDDYEICFTAPLANRDLIYNLFKNNNLNLQRIGKIVEVNKNNIKNINNKDENIIVKNHGQILNIKNFQGFSHF